MYSKESASSGSGESSSSDVTSVMSSSVGFVSSACLKSWESSIVFACKISKLLRICGASVWDWARD